jgi:hypothetical protein
LEVSAGGYLVFYNTASNNFRSTQSGGLSVYSAYDFRVVETGLNAVPQNYYGGCHTSRNYGRKRKKLQA